MKKIILIIPLILLFLLSASISYCEEITDDDRARFGIAQSQVNLGRYGEAVKSLQALHQRYPQNSEITLALAQSLGYSLKLDEALDLLEELKKLSPENENIEFTQANILEANQRFTEARNIYLNLLEKNLSDEKIQLRIADVSSWMGDYPTAVNYYNSLLEKNPGDSSLKLKLADTLLWSKDYKRAIELYEQMGVSPQTDRKRYKNLGDAYLETKQYDQALKIYNQLLGLFPEDLGLKITIADALYGAGKIDQAEEMFKEIIVGSPGDIKLMIKVAEILALRHKYDQAIKICEDILAIDPTNNAAKLWLARILSWTKRYDESIELYAEIIENNPEWIIARREKGRVLGWTRQYGKSVEEYRKIQQTKADKVSEIEMLSKENFYNLFDIGAMRQYESWLSVEPENLEALNDLGQVYAREMRWYDARKVYNDILDITPSHFRAQQALGKVEIYAKSIMLKQGFEWYEADSDSRHVDERYENVFTELEIPLKENFYLNLSQDSYMLQYADPGWVNRERLNLGVAYYNKPWLWLIANYAYSIYNNRIKDSQNFNEEINIKPFDQALLTISHKREDVLDNGEARKMNLYYDGYRACLAFNLNRRLTLSGDYQYSYYNDQNKKRDYEVEASYILLYEPKFLKLIYSYEEYKFTHAKDYLFTPSSFHANKVGFMWRHFLNKEELFWGINETYYAFKYLYNVDVHGQKGHTIYLDFHHDWNDRLSTYIEWHKQFYEHRKIYSENELMVYLKYYF